MSKNLGGIVDLLYPKANSHRRAKAEGKANILFDVCRSFFGGWDVLPPLLGVKGQCMDSSVVCNFTWLE